MIELYDAVEKMPADLIAEGCWGVIAVATQDTVRRLCSVARRQSGLDLLGADIAHLRKTMVATAPPILPISDNAAVA
jgi:hypothetical protein